MDSINDRTISDSEIKRRKKISDSRKGKIPKNISMIAGWNRGKKSNKKWRDKLSKARKGKTPWNKGLKGIQIAWNKGMKGYGAGMPHPWMAKGKDHYNWQGGKSFEPFGLEFNNDLKEVVRNRDRRKCKICEKTELECGEKMTVHHIDYNKLNNNPSNLISLCRSCHLKTNYKRDLWIKYFEKL
jgi:hypothetical protein